MRRGVALFVLIPTLVLSIAGAAAGRGLNNGLAGLQGLLTFPADPVIYAMDPPKDFEDLPGAPVLSPVLGMFTGIVMSTYRASMGLFDILFLPIWVMPTLSPEPEITIFEGVSYE
jgi:hypothetical protein